MRKLDGLQAISVVAVLLIHVTYGRISGGFLGVDIFFVLSGYLIAGAVDRYRLEDRPEPAEARPLGQA